MRWKKVPFLACRLTHFAAAGGGADPPWWWMSHALGLVSAQVNAAPQSPVSGSSSCFNRHDLKPRVGQSLDDAFCDLFCFLRIHGVVRVIFSRVAKCRRNYRDRLMWIGQGTLLI